MIHSQTICAKLLFIDTLLSCQATDTALLLLYGRGVSVKYYSIAFSILPGVAGGLAMELLLATKEETMETQDKCCTIVPYFKVQKGKLEDFKALTVLLDLKPDAF